MSPLALLAVQLSGHEREFEGAGSANLRSPCAAVRVVAAVGALVVHELALPAGYEEHSGEARRA
jgi:hypothetical protein